VRIPFTYQLPTILKMKKKTQKELTKLATEYINKLREHQSRLFIKFADEVVKIVRSKK